MHIYLHQFRVKVHTYMHTYIRIYTYIHTYKFFCKILTHIIYFQVAINKNAILNLHDVVTSSKTKFPEIVFEVASWHGMSMPDQVRVVVLSTYVE